VHLHVRRLRCGYDDHGCGLMRAWAAALAAAGIAETLAHFLSLTWGFGALVLAFVVVAVRASSVMAAASAKTATTEARVNGIIPVLASHQAQINTAQGIANSANTTANTANGAANNAQGTANNALSVANGAIQTGSAGVLGALTVTGSVTIDNNLTVQNQLAASATTLGSLTVFGSQTIDNNLTVQNTLAASATTLGSLFVSGSQTVNTNLTVGGSLGTGGPVTSGGDLHASAAFYIDGNRLQIPQSNASSPGGAPTTAGGYTGAWGNSVNSAINQLISALGSSGLA
jgi:hypothetical protein